MNKGCHFSLLCLDAQAPCPYYDVPDATDSTSAWV
jgi:hypothetical protein